ncbi:protein ASPARTIC PROTEASE IN GUARD CELL 1-like protein [Carex littledalei]|uniref:Protein ASPARTIC PROTEASE IN GUARD CELL 1-like protein n=1 Tax=Carex littledalei TaxID=544730 RepID=A0A833VHQ4_9POAL|nr:protein ASPARTIC PROTEASE IN GUARD CELL 1-like protein [Carex littledalei]
MAAPPIPSLLRLLPLLLFPLFFSISLTNGSLQYEMLRLSPLQNPALVSHSSLRAETLTLDSTSATSLHLRIAHRDSLFPSNSTPEETFLRRLSRDFSRVSSLASNSQNPNRSSTARPHVGSGFTSPVISGLSHGSGEYFTRLGIGTPPTSSFMVLDTGSDIIWLQCAPCRHCYSQVDPIYDPRRSHSYSAIPCLSPVCRHLDSPGCDSRRKSCLYEVSYGDGSLTAGDLATETLSFSGGAHVSGVALGCGHDNQGLFVAAAGLLGLGRGPLSFPTQSGRQYGRRFSYCLVDRTSSRATTRTSSAIFGNTAVPGNATWTPLVQNPKMETFYYVEMTGISIGGTRVAGVAASDLKLDPVTGKGGVIIDSGTSVTRLAGPAYAAMRDAFKAGAAGLREAPGGFSLFDTCYDLSGRKVVKVPTVAMHFAGNGVVQLPAENYLIPVDTKGTFCFAFAGTESGVSIIGNIQQQGFRVVFDGDNGKIGFVPRGC